MGKQVRLDLTVLLPVLVGLLYAGTGGWSAERWNGALAIMGLGASAKSGYTLGYFTYNPELRGSERRRGVDGRFQKGEE